VRFEGEGTNGVDGRGEDHQSLLKALLLNSSGDVLGHSLALQVELADGVRSVVELDSEHESLSTNLGNEVRGGGRGREREDVLGFEDVKNGVGGGTGDDISGVGASKRSSGHDTQDVLVGSDTTQRVTGEGGGRSDEAHCDKLRGGGDGPVGKALRKDNDVSLDSRVLGAPELSSSSVTRLNLVDDEQDVVLVADLSETLEVGVRGGDVASLTEEGLDEDGSSVGRCCLTLEEELKLVESGLDEVSLARLARDTHGVPEGEGGGVDARHDRSDGLRVDGLGRGQGRSSVRSTVVRSGHADDVGLAGLRSSDLDGGLDGLRAGVPEEDLRVALPGQLLAQSVDCKDEQGFKRVNFAVLEAREKAFRDAPSWT
jgi:hypothetical protein